MLVRSQHGALAGFQDNIRGETVILKPPGNELRLLHGGRAVLSKAVHDGIDILIVAGRGILRLPGRGDSLLRPVYGNLLYVLEILFPPVHAVLNQVIDQIV